MKIEIYGKDNCPFCDRALHKAQAMMQETSEHEYSYWKLGKDFTREDLFEKFPNARTFPQITVDGELVGGWTEFEKIQWNIYLNADSALMWGQAAMLSDNDIDTIGKFIEETMK